VKPALQKASHAGIRTIMITGDYPNTAQAIAEEIGLLRPGHQVMTGADLNRLTDEEMVENVKVTDVYARREPGAQNAHCGCAAGEPGSCGK